jgi:ribosomal protein L15
LKLKRLKASHLGEIGILNVKLQNLETKNGALRSTSEVSNVTSLDPYHVDKLINSHKMDRIGLGFKKGKSSFESNHNRGPKEKGEHSQTSITKFKFNGEQYSNYQFFTKKGLTPLKKELPKMKSSHISNAKLDKKSPNHAFRYKYNNRDYKNKNKFQNNDRNTFNPKWSNKTYFNGPDGWFYEIKNKSALQNQTQRNGLARDVPQHHNRVHSNKTERVTSRIAHRSHGSLKSSMHEVKYQQMFKQGSTTQKQSTTMCNYCCHLGHTSLECRFRNVNNKQNVVWVPKATLA